MCTGQTFSFTSSRIRSSFVMGGRGLAVLLACLLLPLAQGQAAQTGTVAEKLQRTYQNISSMKAEFTQSLTHKESGAKETRNGVLLFKKPLQVRWETKSPSPELLFVNESVIWNVFPEEKAAFKFSPALAQDSRSIIRVVTGQSRLDQDFKVEELGTEGDLAKIRLYPKEPTQSLVEALFWVDPKTSLIKRIRIYDFYGNENEIAFTSQQVNPIISDSEFAYVPPKDFAIEDKTGDNGAAGGSLIR